MSRAGQGELCDRTLLYCIFCKDISTFKIEEHKEYKTHLEKGHKVGGELMNLVAINFLGKNVKAELIEQAKNNTKKGDLFNCGLCFNVSFVVGEFFHYKKHLETKHNISYEFGTLLAMNLSPKDVKAQLFFDAKEDFIRFMEQPIVVTKENNKSNFLENTKDLIFTNQKNNCSSTKHDKDIESVNVDEYTFVSFQENVKETKVENVFEELDNHQKQQPEKPKTKLKPPKEEVPVSSQNQLSCLYCSFVPKNGPKTSMDHKKTWVS